ncbi:peptidase, partial [Paenibacillus sp. TAF58]
MPNLNTELQKQIHEWIRLHREEGTCFLQKIVRIPSTQGNEKEAQALIASKFHELRLDVDMWE